MAGRRAGLVGERSGLWYEFLRIVTELLPSIVVIENVPGLLSSWSAVEPPPFEIQARDFDSESEAERWARSVARDWDVDEASDFETLLLGLQELGYGVGWTVLDSQYFGVAQRRERVFAVAGLRERGGSAAGGGKRWENPQAFGDYLRKYFLSPKACAGILRRAEKRGRELPEMLRRALTAAARGGASEVNRESTLSKRKRSEGGTAQER